MTKDEENLILSSDHPSKTYQDIANEFSLSYEQVRYIFKKNKQPKLTATKKLSDITQEQVQFLIENKDSYSLSFFEKKFNTTEKVLRNLLKKEGVNKLRVKTYSATDEWSLDELDLLVDNYFDKTNEELAKIIGRSDRAIAKKLYALGLCRESPWSVAEVDFLKKNADKPYDTLAFYLERSVKAVKHKYLLLNLAPKRSETSIELFVKQFLDANKLVYVFNTQLSKEFKYKPDFTLHSEKVIIEVQGDYWHANPSLYDEDDCTEKQLEARSKDLLKKKYYESLGYKVVWVWESDVKHNPKCVKNELYNLLVSNGPSTKVTL